MSAPHLHVVAGVDLGMQFTVRPEGSRLGRSSKNDIVLVDPLLSRHHCRLFFKDNLLWITDLGSANLTVVNGKQIAEVALQPNDVITVGDTRIRVLSNLLEAAPAQGAPAPAKPAGGPVDLGLGKAGQPQAMPKPPSIWFLLLLAAMSTAVCLFIWYPKLAKKQAAKPTPPVVQQPARPDTLEIAYEKVTGSTQNIFRYSLTLSRERMLRVQMDDIENNRHVTKEKIVDEEYVNNLCRTMKDSGFFTLDAEYRGIQPDSLDQWEIAITMGRKAHRSRVINRLEPEAFKSVRETIEAFSKTELGLWAIQFPVEKLRQMAEEAWLQGKKLYQERAVKPENLADAVKSLKEADWHLETVDPKPDYYAEMMTLITDCEQELNTTYEQASFRAYQAIRNHEWDIAARELRTICEMIPDRSDSRHSEARKKLLEVESRMEKKP